MTKIYAHLEQDKNLPNLSKKLFKGKSTPTTSLNLFKKSFMRKIVLLSVLLTSFITISVKAQVNVSGASFGSNTFSTLKAAFDAINGASQAGNNILIEITANTTEPVPVHVNGPSDSLGSGTWASILIRPSGGAARTISGAATAGFPLVDFNGSDNVTIDGLNTGGDSLIFVNTTVSAAAGTSTIRLQNDATNNLITNCKINGSSTGAAGALTGNIVIGGSVLPVGGSTW